MQKVIHLPNGSTHTVPDGVDASRSSRRWLRGDEWLAKYESLPERIWGTSRAAAWMPGESLYIVSPAGIGKTTLALNLLLARLGDSVGDVLGMPVLPADDPVALLSADRPPQAVRRLVKMLASHQSHILERLIVWEWNPEITPASSPERFGEWVWSTGAKTVVIDNLGAVQPGLARDEIGSATNTALSRVLAEGIEVVVLHHTRKGDGGTALDRVMGSSWLTNGAGSVLMIAGKRKKGRGRIVVTHEKPPMEPVPDIRATIDFNSGVINCDRVETDRVEHESVESVLQRLTVATAKVLASHVFGLDSPGEDDIEALRRMIRPLVGNGVLSRPTGRGNEVEFYLATAHGAVHADVPR